MSYLFWNKHIVQHVINEIPPNLAPLLCTCIPSAGGQLTRVASLEGVVHWVPVNNLERPDGNGGYKLKNGCGKPILEDALFRCEICEEYFIERPPEKGVISVLRHALNGFRITEPNTRMYFCAECV